MEMDHSSVAQNPELPDSVDEGPGEHSSSHYLFISILRKVKENVTYYKFDCKNSVTMTTDCCLNSITESKELPWIADQQKQLQCVQSTVFMCL